MILPAPKCGRSHQLPEGSGYGGLHPLFCTDTSRSAGAAQTPRREHGLLHRGVKACPWIRQIAETPRFPNAMDQPRMIPVMGMGLPDTRRRG